jgi:hypothetical protein
MKNIKKDHLVHINKKIKQYKKDTLKWVQNIKHIKKSRKIINLNLNIL